MFPLILLGAGLAGFLVGKNQKKQTIGKATPREIAREKQRRIISLAAFHQAKRKGLNDAIAVATAKAVYQAKGGRDIAHIARLDSMDKEFIGVGGPRRENRQQRRAGRQENRQQRRAGRQENRQQRQAARQENRATSGRKPARRPVNQSPQGQGQRQTASPVNQGPRSGTGSGIPSSRQGFQDQGFQDQGFQDQGFQDQGFQDQGFQDQGFEDQGFEDQGFEEQEALDPIIVINQAAPESEPEAEGPEAEDPEAPEDQTAAAVAFTRAKDNGEDDTKAREKAKAAYQAMGGSDKAFLDRIMTWSEG